MEHSDHYRNQSHESLKAEFKNSRAGSQLSNFGSSVLQMGDRDIYNLQKPKFDIVSQAPVWHQETIKKYPKYSLEDKDVYYYRRMAPKNPENGNQTQREKATGSRYEPDEGAVKVKKEAIAGMHVYPTNKEKLEV